MTCTVTETLNGEWELTLTHPIDDAGKWTRLAEGNILRAHVPAAMTPRVDLVTQQYQTTTYDVQIYKITTKSGPLRLRSGTGTKYKILGKYKKGKEVTPTVRVRWRRTRSATASFHPAEPSRQASRIPAHGRRPFRWLHRFPMPHRAGERCTATPM